MSKQVDERVVEMRFDNKHFESNVSTTMSTLEKLKQSLKLKGATQGLESVNTAARKIDFRQIENTACQAGFRIQDVWLKLSSVLEYRVAGKIIDIGKNMAKALTIDPIKTGFDEYETKINAIQTIMSNTASKGTTMEDVTRVLDELNTYADKTIYNFAEMTRNIGTFTAAGVGLEESASAIQGIANLAAASGSSSQQASTAMYQLSQALATGTVKLMDWNSVVNAGMGGEKFQLALKETAREYGVAVDDIIEKNGSFRDSLHEEWLTADILNTTLRKFTTEGASEYADKMVEMGKYTKEQAEALKTEAQNMEDAATKVKTFTQLMDTLKESAQSGWSKTWELLFGDFLEARDFFSDLSATFGKIIDKSSEARNNLIEGALGSKWDDFNKKIEKAGISTDKFNEKLKATAKENGFDVDNLTKKYGSLSNAISKGAIPVDIITKTLRKFTGTGKDAVKVFDDANEKLKYFQDIVDKVWSGKYGNGEERVEALTKAGYEYAAVQALVNKTEDGHRLTLEDLSDAQLKAIGYTKEEIEALNKLADEAEATGTPLNELINDLSKPSGRELLLGSLTNIIQGLIKSVGAVKDAFVEIFPPMTSDQLYGLIEGFNKLTNPLNITEETADKLKRTFKGVFAILDIILTIIGGPISIAFKLLKSVLGSLNIPILDFTASIGDAIVGFRDWIDETFNMSKIVDKLAPGLKKAVDAVRKWFSELKKSDNLPRDIITGLVNGLKSGIKTVVSAVVNLGKTIITTIKDVLGIHSPSTVFAEIGRNIIQGLINGIKWAVNGLWSILKSIGSTIADIGNSVNFQAFIDNVKNIASNVGKVIGNMVKKVSETLGKVDWGTVLAAVLSLGTVKAINTIANAIKGISSAFDGLGDMFQDVGNGIKSWFKSMGKAKVIQARADALFTLAKAVAVLALSIAIIAFIPEDKLLTSVGAVVVLVGLLSALVFALSKIQGNFKDAISKIGVVVGISASLLMLAIAINKLTSIEWGDIPKVVAVLTILSLGLVMILKAISMVANPANAIQLKNAGSMLLKMSVALLLLTFVIKQIDKMDGDTLFKGIAVITAFEVLCIGLMATTKLLGPHAGKVGGMLLKISVALLVLTFVIKRIDKLEPRTIFKGMVVIAAFEALFVGLMAMTRLLGPQAGKAGAMLLQMSAAILILTVAIHLISFLKPEVITKGIVVIGLLEVFFAGVVAMSQFAGKHADKAGEMLIKMSSAIFILTASIAILALISPEGLVKALAAISVLSAVYSGLIFITQYAQATKNMSKVLLKMAISIGILAGLIVILSFIDPSRLDNATIAITRVMSIYALMVKATQYAKNTKSMRKTLWQMVLVIGILTGLVVALSLLGEPEGLIQKTIALSILLMSLATSMKILNKVSINKTAAAQLPIMLAIITGLAGILTIMGVLPIQNTIQNAIALGILVNALASSILILNKVSLNKTATAQIPIMLAVVAGLAAILSIMGVLPIQNSIANAIALGILVNALASAILILNKVTLSKTVATQIPIMLAVVAGLAAVLSIMGVLPIEGSIGNAIALGLLLNAMAVAMAILNNAQLVTAATIGKIAIMTAVVAGLAVILYTLRTTPVHASLGNAIALGVLLNAMAIAMAILTFSLTVTPMAILNMALMGLVIAELAAILAVMANMGIEVSISTALSLSTLLLAMSASLVLLGAVGLMGPAALIGIGMLAALIAGIGGLVIAIGWLVTQFPILKTFLNEGIPIMEQIGYAIGSFFGNIVGGFTSGIGSGLPAIATDLSTFMTNLQPFIEGANNIGDGVGDNIRSLADAILTLVGTNVLNALTSWLTGGGSLSAFGEQLAEFGPKFNTFAKSLTGVNPDVVSAAGTAAKSLAEMASALPASGGVWQWIVGENQGLAAFGTALAEFGPKFADFAQSIDGVEGSEVSATAQSISDVVNALKNAGKVVPDKVKGFSEALAEIGTEGINKFIEAFDDAGEKTKEAIGSLLTVSVKAFKDSYDEFYGAGKYVVEGFAAGINDHTYLAEAKAIAMANAAEAAAKGALEQNSPSKVFYRIGLGTGEGFVDAMDDYQSVVRKASGEMAGSATGGFSNAISKIKDAIDSDMDVQPTIRPVLDLSNVESGAGYISNMLGSNSLIGVRANVGTVSSMMNKRGQNGANGEVVSAINKLRKDLGNVGGTYSIGNVTFEEGSDVADAFKTIVRAARVERRT